MSDTQKLSGFTRRGLGGLLIGGVVLARSTAAASKPFLWGVNLAGGEFGRKDGVLQKDYVYPTAEQLKYYSSKGMVLLRIPFLSWRLLRGYEVNPLDFGALRTIVDIARSTGIIVVLDRHEFGLRYDGEPIANALHVAEFVRTWEKIAESFKHYENVWYGVMNEPHRQTPRFWAQTAAEVVQAISEINNRATVLVMGSRWGTAAGFVNTGNAEAFDRFVPLSENVVVEAHQYLDDGSGNTSNRPRPGAGRSSLVDVTEWARRSGRKLFLGEYAFTADADYTNEGIDLINYKLLNRDVWIGSAFWSGGIWWAEGRSNYQFSIEPRDPSSLVDRPQMKMLNKFITKGQF